MGKAETEHVHLTMSRMLLMVANELQNDWDARMPHAEASLDTSVKDTTRFVPKEMHSERMLRLPLTVIQRRARSAHQSLSRDHLENCDLVRERQPLAYRLWCASVTPSPRPASHARAKS